MNATIPHVGRNLPPNHPAAEHAPDNFIPLGYIDINGRTVVFNMPAQFYVMTWTCDEQYIEWSGYGTN